MDVTNEDKRRNLQFFDVLESMRPIVRQLAVGTNEFMARQLVEKSKQQHIVKFTPKDAVKRFKDVQMYQEWYENDHTVHWLLGDDYDLAGVIWYRSLGFPKQAALHDLNPSETFAIRLYEGYVGHHLSLPFMKLSLRTYIDQKLSSGQKVQDMWLTTTIDNMAAISSYERLGYSEICRDDKCVWMTISASNIKKIVQSID